MHRSILLRNDFARRRSGSGSSSLDSDSVTIVKTKPCSGHLADIIKQRADSLLKAYIEKIEFYKPEFASRLCELITELLASEVTELIDLKQNRLFIKVWLGEGEAMEGDAVTRSTGQTEDDLMVVTNYSNNTLRLAAIVFATKRN